MTSHETGLLTFRALSIYAFIRGLEQAERIIRLWPREWPDQDRLLWQTIIYSQLFAPLLILAIFSLALWKATPHIINKMFAGEQSTNQSEATLSEVKALVIVGFGLYLLVDTIPDLSQTLYFISTSLSSEIDSSTRSQISILRLRTILKIVVVFGLLFGAKGLSNIFSKIRNE